MASKHSTENRNVDNFTLKKSEKELIEFLIKRIPSSIAVFDTNLHFLYTSNQFIKESGLSAEDNILGSHWYDVIPDMPKKWQTAHSKTLQGQHLKCDEDITHRENGQREWWRWESLPWYDENCKIGGMIIALNNITKQKSDERNLKQTLKSLNETNRALARFAHICAHDLNEPIRAIANYCQLIKRFHNKDNDETLNKYLLTIAENACHMAGLVKTLSDYSQLRIRRIKPEVVDFNHVIKDIIKTFQQRMDAKQLSIKFDYMPSVHVDCTLMHTAVYNIIDNAIKFNHNTVKEIRINVKDCQHFWLFSIKDNGIGMDARYLNKIFIEFTRLNTKSDYPGSGMGLAQSRKIIEDHNGRIWVESVLGAGSTIYFTILKNITH